MASIEVRFKNGDMARWELHDAMDLGDLVKVLTRSTTGGAKAVSFGVTSEGGNSTEYDFVGLAMAEVASWQVRGMFDATAGAALWADLEGMGGGE